jgi:hypothetical protein
VAWAKELLPIGRPGEGLGRKQGNGVAELRSGIGRGRSRIGQGALAVGREIAWLGLGAAAIGLTPSAGQ